MRGEVVLDASVAAKLFFEEVGSGQAAELADSGVVLLAPDLIHVEFASIAAKKARRREISDALGASALAGLAAVLDEVVPSGALAGRAYAFAVEQGCSAYDGLYLALAEQRGCPVITADLRLVRRIVDAGMAHLIQALERE